MVDSKFIKFFFNVIILFLGIILFTFSQNVYATDVEDNSEKDKLRARFDELTQNAEKADSQAQFELAEIYRKGIYFPNNERRNIYQDYKKSYDLYKKSYSKGNISSILAFANFQCNGSAILNYETDFESCVQNYSKAIEMGSSDAMLKLGSIYEDGIEDYKTGRTIPKDRVKALNLYKDALKHNNFEAFKKLTRFYYSEEKFDKAIEYAKLAAEKDYKLYLQLSEIYFKGKTVARNTEKAVFYLKLFLEKTKEKNEIEKATAMLAYILLKTGETNVSKELLSTLHSSKNPETLSQVGELYIKSPETFLKGVELLEQAAEKNDRRAALELIKIYSNGTDSINKNLDKANAYYEIYKQNAPALWLWRLSRVLFNLHNNNFAYDNTFTEEYHAFLKTKTDERYDILHQSALRGHGLSLRTLADGYYSGEDYESNKLYKFKKDLTKSFYYTERLAFSGDTDYLVQLGYMYKFGEGTREDNRKAFKYFLLASQKNSAEGQLFVGNMYENGEGVPQNFKKAFQYYSLAAEKGKPFAHASLGRLYFYGIGIKKDSIKGLGHVLVAIALDSNDSDWKELKNELSSKMTTIEIDKAQEFAEKVYDSLGIE